MKIFFCVFPAWNDGFQKNSSFGFYIRDGICVTSDLYNQNSLIWVFFWIRMLDGSKNPIFIDGGKNIFKSYSTHFLQPLVLLFAPPNFFHIGFFQLFLCACIVLQFVYDVNFCFVRSSRRGWNTLTSSAYWSMVLCCTFCSNRVPCQYAYSGENSLWIRTTSRVWKIDLKSQNVFFGVSESSKSLLILLSALLIQRFNRCFRSAFRIRSIRR